MTHKIYRLYTDKFIELIRCILYISLQIESNFDIDKYGNQIYCQYLGRFQNFMVITL